MKYIGIAEIVNKTLSGQIEVYIHSCLSENGGNPINDADFRRHRMLQVPYAPAEKFHMVSFEEDGLFCQIVPMNEFTTILRR